MITLDQVLLLEKKVESAIARIQQLQAENDALRNKCAELTNALSSKSEQLSSFETNQSQIESGILNALDRLNQIENSVLKVAGQVQSETTDTINTSFISKEDVTSTSQVLTSSIADSVETKYTEENSNNNTETLSSETSTSLKSDINNTSSERKVIDIGNPFQIVQKNDFQNDNELQSSESSESSAPVTTELAQNSSFANNIQFNSMENVSQQTSDDYSSVNTFNDNSYSEETDNDDFDNSDESQDSLGFDIF